MIIIDILILLASLVGLALCYVLQTTLRKRNVSLTTSPFAVVYVFIAICEIVIIIQHFL